MTNQTTTILGSITGSVRQSITTKYLGPTDHHEARVKATAPAGSVTIGWDHALDITENHAMAAYALAVKFTWVRTAENDERDPDGCPGLWRFCANWAMGGTGNGYTFVNCEARRFADCR